MRAAPLLLVLACGSSPATHPRFDADAALQSNDFFALPYPNDARRTAQGIDLSGFPNPRNSSLLVDYVAAMREQPGLCAVRELRRARRSFDQHRGLRAARRSADRRAHPAAEEVVRAGLALRA